MIQNFRGGGGGGLAKDVDNIFNAQFFFHYLKKNRIFFKDLKLHILMENVYSGSTFLLCVTIFVVHNSMFTVTVSH
jgi:hypothetical protein